VARIFFALWPDEPAAAQLERLALELASATQGKAVPRGKIHLTLAFLGEVAPEHLETVVALAGKLRGRSFEARFDCIGAFRQARVAWAGMSKPPAALLELQASLVSGLRGAGFALEDRPYAPHITLARRIARGLPRTPHAPIAWNARSLTLVRSDTGKGTYSVVESWGLA
jgi:2'-5' RNA ligase